MSFLDDGSIRIHMKVTYNVMFIEPDDAPGVITSLKEQIRQRPDPEDRSEPWEGYERTPHGFIYSFAKEMRILESRRGPN